jgi:hypothetical protein
MVVERVWYLSFMVKPPFSSIPLSHYSYFSLTQHSRVDLHPITTHSSAENNDDLAPPLNTPEAEPSHRRRTAFRDILLLRQRPNASAEERISALRRLREQRSERDVTSSANASTEDRRSRRISVRLSDVFTGRRRERSPGGGEGGTDLGS